MAQSINQILGFEIQIQLTNEYLPEKNGIYIGEIGSNLTASFPGNHTSKLTDEWENFIIESKQQNLIITGSDIRGTVFGIFELQEKMGVLPSKWWADAKSERKEKIILEFASNSIQQGPSVQSRGIFLNDEDWGLQPWAAKSLESETNNIGKKPTRKFSNYCYV